VFQFQNFGSEVWERKFDGVSLWSQLLRWIAETGACSADLQLLQAGDSAYGINVTATSIVSPPLTMLNGVTADATAVAGQMPVVRHQQQQLPITFQQGINFQQQLAGNMQQVDLYSLPLNKYSETLNSGRLLY
jgi:hypothetical protein